MFRGVFVGRSEARMSGSSGREGGDLVAPLRELLSSASSHLPPGRQPPRTAHGLEETLAQLETVDENFHR